jgi:hypothetical protein
MFSAYEDIHYHNCYSCRPEWMTHTCNWGCGRSFSNQSEVEEHEEKNVLSPYGDCSE